MKELTRRSFLGTIPAAPALCLAGKPTDARVESIEFGYEDYKYRAPLKFGGAIVDRVTLLNVNCAIRTRNGKTAKGFGSMPLGNIWAFPSQMPYERTLNAMKE